ncbi:acetyl-CoA carboxylase biotin carboxylase subunit family protein [Streptomyces sp. NPDC021093]|uniref:acetyl-CoA carboxylase biotin carboxylase subunit family protein n=1 Tax=Streptomyces sp. NPDC021093 TaxID=3365112 RepID=UPI0037B9D12B
MAGEPGFLILSHQLMSMVGPLATALSRRGIKTYVLASKPTRDVDSGWRSEVETLYITDAHALHSSDIDLFLKELSAADVNLLGCVTVWDAYRELMAYANQQIGTADLSEEGVRLLRDKLAMRECLREAGLSEVTAWPLEEDRYLSLQDRTRYFIKPREGLASLGAFRADRLGEFGELDTLWEGAQGDSAYAGVFTGRRSFILEEFIDGIECSFEVSVLEGESTVHAVHEKIDLQQSGRTTLENACVCPPRSLDPGEVGAGIAYVRRCLRALGVTTGVYHAEARFQRGRGWELVEANPRIGGACIVPSTRRHSGVDLLERWLDLLLGQAAPSDGPGQSTDRSTFFRVFFGEPGRQIARLDRRPGRIEALEEKIFVKEGEHLPLVDREIFIGQALWDITSLNPDVLEDFFHETESHLKVEYRP